MGRLRSPLKGSEMGRKGGGPDQPGFESVGKVWSTERSTEEGFDILATPFRPGPKAASKPSRQKQIPRSLSDFESA